VETFVLRIWTPAEQEDTDQPLDLRGLAEHIRSGEHCAFRGTAELTAFLEQQTRPTSVDIRPA
jgi:hypothetical protein